MLTSAVALAYGIAAKFEGEFTAKIYKNANKRAAAIKKR